MIPRVLLLYVILFNSTLLSLQSQQISQTNQLTISILTLGEIPDRDIAIVNDSLQSFCGCDVGVLNRIVNPIQLLSYENGIDPFKPKTTDFLYSFATKKGEKMIGITDIPFQNMPGNSAGNTIRGLTRGNGAIISNAQIIRDALGYDMNYDELLVKVAKHELVHLLGMGHCNDTLCIMTSSFPIPDNFINSKSLCDSCSVYIGKYF